MKKRPSQGKGDAGDYKVGYCKPPEETRFKPGRSGNPKGRPKGTKNLKADLIEELDERILVREGEKTKLVSKQRAAIKALVVQALRGNVRANALLVSMRMRFDDSGEAANNLTEALQEDELEILRAFEARVRGGEASPTGSPSDRDTSQENPS